MLLEEQLKSTTFSSAEQAIVNFILSQPEKLNSLTIKELCLQTHTHPTSVLRVCKKLQFKGWTDFREAYLQEWNYIHDFPSQIDVNLPFRSTDKPLELAHKLAALEKESIQDTVSLLDMEELLSVCEKMSTAKQVKIFLTSLSLDASAPFVRNLRSINIQAQAVLADEWAAYEAAQMTEADFSLLISYTGENTSLLQLMPLLKERNVPTVAITSLGNNKLSQQATYSLHISAREKLYEKIGDFASTVSMIYLFDLIYSFLFQKNYFKNLEIRKQLGQRFNPGKPSTHLMNDRIDRKGHLKK